MANTTAPTVHPPMTVPDPQAPVDTDTDTGSDTGLVLGDDGHLRCAWGAGDALYVAYHDEEWGRPLRDEHALFGLLCLEFFQSGLSWLTILRKRPAFFAAFDGFDPEVVAGYGDDDVARLMADAGIVRNRAKIDAAIANAGALVAMHAEGETLVDLLFSFVPGPGADDRPAGRFTGMGQIPSSTTTSKALAKALKARGFRFVGPVVAYALMQSAGVVDDHLEGCWVAT
ncbi:MAG TPA: DNA-3-methyladenine glycosylase I [Acidimicrobiales bacterium]|nr:DNA-3-methyladenine glycosylase I [Acidimicrobiales bacterium]